MYKCYREPPEAATCDRNDTRIEIYKAPLIILSVLDNSIVKNNTIFLDLEQKSEKYKIKRKVKKYPKHIH